MGRIRARAVVGVIFCGLKRLDCSTEEFPNTNHGIVPNPFSFYSIGRHEDSLRYWYDGVRDLPTSVGLENIHTHLL